MAFCRGCGKEMHETAPHCPECGAPQVSRGAAASDSSWLAISSLVSAILAGICALQVETFDHDQITGGVALSVIGLVSGAINLQQKRPGKGLAITAVVMSAVSLLVLIGS